MLSLKQQEIKNISHSLNQITNDHNENRKAFDKQKLAEKMKEQVMDDLEKEKDRLADRIKQLKAEKETLEQNFRGIEQANKTMENNL